MANNKEIKYGGYSAQPSDYECQDGDLAVSINLICEDGALKPLAEPDIIKNLGADNNAMFIHKTSLFTHYIIYGADYSVSYIDAKGSGGSTPLDDNYKQIDGLTHFNAVGNTLLAFTQTEIIYFLWKDNSYTCLGNHIPDIDLSFGLIGHPRLFSQSDESKKTFTISFDGIAESAINNEFSENNKTRITEQVMAKVNKFIREQTIEQGRFCFPFFVRYALRLFDGSLVNHSAPILMNPSTSTCPIVFWKHIKGKGEYNEAELDIMLVAADLDYRLSWYDAYELDRWSDIVSGIDIFISKPIYTFDQEGKCTSWNDSDNFYTKFIGKLYAKNPYSVSTTIAEDRLLGSFDSYGFLECYTEWTYSQIYSLYFSSNRTYPDKTLHLPEFSDNKVNETLRNTANFYKLKSLDVSELLAEKGKRNEIVIENEYLQSLVTREVMTDDYLTHDLLAAETSYAFNNRLNLSGVYRKPFRGFYGLSMFAYCNGMVNISYTDGKVFASRVTLDAWNMKITVYIKDNGREYKVEADDYSETICIFNSIDLNNGGKYKRSWGCYLFYPNVNAHKMVVSSGDGSYLINLKPHEFLNGAYALLDYELVRQNNFTDDDLPKPSYGGILDSNYISQSNKVFTSEINNPFFFPLSGINTVGTGKIMGICSAAKALSQGQFGQFPLYAFTDEGVWAMEVSETGTYRAKQPITRDVCINPDGITQIDSAVLFPSDRGIMLISGSTTTCISDVINTEYPFDAQSLPCFDKLYALLDSDSNMSAVPFSEFLKKCRMIYDYVHQHIIVYAPGITYAYVFSLKSKLWGMTFSNIKSHLNSYPEALAVNDKGQLINYSVENAGPVKCLYISRPLKLDMPNIHKTIDTIIQRGFFHKGNVTSVVYGSRDLVSWYLIWSSKDHYLRGFRGTPYKYFRIGGVADLKPGESVYGASVQFTPRLTNQPR